MIDTSLWESQGHQSKIMSLSSVLLVVLAGKWGLESATLSHTETFCGFFFPSCLWTPALTMQREDGHKVLTEMWNSEHNDSKAWKAWRIFLVLYPHQHPKGPEKFSITHLVWLLNLKVQFAYEMCYISLRHHILTPTKLISHGNVF